MRKLKFGLISYAHPHALRYAPTIAGGRLSELVAISGDGPNSDVARGEARKYGARFYKNYEELLRDERVEAVYIASESYRHAEMAIRAMEEGKHVLLEKPIALNLKDADNVIKAAKKAGVKLMLPFNPRFTEPLRKAKELLDAGEIGPLEYVHAISENVKPPIFIQGVDISWFLDKRKAGGGGFMDTAPHGVDSLIWLTGGAPKKVYADIGDKVYGFPVDDIGTAILEFGDVVAVLTAGWGNPKGYSYGIEMKYYLVGREGFLDVRTAYPDFTVYQDRAEKIYWDRPDVTGIVESFARAVLKDEPVPIDGETGKLNLAVILAAYESSEKKRPVRVKL